MAGTRNTAKVGESFTLEATFTLSGAVADVADIARVEIQDVDANILATVTSVVHLSTGKYRVTIPALTQGGDLYDVWAYTPVAGAEEATLQLTVTVDQVEGAQGEATADASPPDAGALSVCTLTATFLDAGGDGVEGVFVRFTPRPGGTQPTSYGFVAREVTAQSDATGAFAMNVLKGMTGVLSVTGLGLVREVTIPSVATVDLFDLVSTTTDLLTVQETAFVTLPRTS